MDEEIKSKLLSVSSMLRDGEKDKPKLTKIGEGENGIKAWLFRKYPEPIVSGEIAQRLNIGTGRVANALKDLENKGIIIRKKDKDDKRKVLVYFTNYGYESTKKDIKNIDKCLDELISIYGKEKFISFLDELETICGICSKIKMEDKDIK